MQEFKKGDLLERTENWNYGIHKLGTQAIVDYVDLPNKGVYFEGDTNRYSLLAYKLVPPDYPNPPHKHVELIKAWADGADIEFFNATTHTWCGDRNPRWWNNYRYRIKPTKSDKEVKIEKLEQQARELADEISKLKE